MERPELERILDGLGRMIQRAGALRAILETLVASSDGDQHAVSDASDALNAFGGFFWPVIEAFEDTLPLTLSKALDRDKRTMSLRAYCGLSMKMPAWPAVWTCPVRSG